MRANKIGEGKYTLYLEECPDCGSCRKLNTDKLFKAGGFGLAGIIASILVGAPVMGLLAAIGLIKLAIAGTITYAMAARLIKLNYEFLVKLNEENFYDCPKCGSSKLVKIDEVLGG